MTKAAAGGLSRKGARTSAGGSAFLRFAHLFHPSRVTEQWSLTRDLSQGLRTPCKCLDQRRNSAVSEIPPLLSLPCRGGARRKAAAGARTVPLAGGKTHPEPDETARRWSLGGDTHCSAGCPPGHAGQSPALRRCLSGPVSRAECYVSIKTTTTTPNNFQPVQCSTFPTCRQSRRERSM